MELKLVDAASGAPIPRGVDLGSPINTYLDRLREHLRSEDAGEVASYIPELLRANPDHFGISIATVDGRVYSSGETSEPFTIQSVSKPFMYGYALREYDKAFVHDHVGVEPTGEAFNSVRRQTFPER